MFWLPIGGFGLPKNGFGFLICWLCQFLKAVYVFEVIFWPSIYQKFDCSKVMTWSKYEKAKPIFGKPKPSSISCQGVVRCYIPFLSTLIHEILSKQSNSPTVLLYMKKYKQSFLNCWLSEHTRFHLLNQGKTKYFQTNNNEG